MGGQGWRILLVVVIGEVIGYMHELPGILVGTVTPPKP